MTGSGFQVSKPMTRGVCLTVAHGLRKLPRRAQPGLERGPAGSAQGHIFNLLLRQDHLASVHSSDNKG